MMRASLVHLQVTLYHQQFTPSTPTGLVCSPGASDGHDVGAPDGQDVGALVVGALVFTKEEGQFS